MKVLVCGSRDFRHQDLLHTILTGLAEIKASLVVVQGGARGADRMARQWAEQNGFKFRQYDADWDRYGPLRAGRVRNRQMYKAEKPHLVVAFYNKERTGGTKDMVEVARRGKTPVWEIFGG